MLLSLAGYLAIGADSWAAATPAHSQSWTAADVSSRQTGAAHGFRESSELVLTWLARESSKLAATVPGLIHDVEDVGCLSIGSINQQTES